MKKKLLAAAILSGMFIQPVLASDQPVLVNIKRMSLETVTKIALAAIKQCRKEGVQIAVTVVDRGGHHVCA